MNADAVRPPAVTEAWTRAAGSAYASAAFTDTYGEAPAGVWAAPGRVNLIGEHVDYNGGLCLPIALPHRTFAAVTPRSHGRVRVVSALDPGAVWHGILDDVAGGQSSGLAAYVAGTAWAMRADGLEIGGFDVAVASCVPLGAGLSSSAALECSIALALDELSGAGLGTDDDGRARLATACVRAENEVVGAPTGGLDQAASLRCTAGHALLLDSRDGAVSQVPFDLTGHGLALLVIDTRAEHALVDGQYGARRAACERAAQQLDVRWLADIEDLDNALARLEDETDRRRVRHVVTEIARVRDFADLVSRGRVDEVGPIMDASHASLRVDYEVSCVELDVATQAARDAGALGARMTGGGFGGSAIALVRSAAVAEVTTEVAARFAEAGFSEPGFLVAEAGPPAERVS